jgi:BirA family biotin operon repressor/biotin-[acetyl-CoA-carboxylase] ligase
MFDLPRIANSGLVRHVDFHESLVSTSDRALELAVADNPPLPLLVLTERQTDGRGRGSNRWRSSAGALTFSLVLDAGDKRLRADHRSRVAIVGGLAVCQALSQAAPRTKWHVKWPNDVYANGRKVCGILCESAPGYPQRLVVGIGINVNNSQRDGALPPAATALVDLDELTRDLTDVLLAVLDQFDAAWNKLTAGGFAELAAEYRRYCLLTGKTLRVTAGQDRIVGVCRGIDEQGALVLATEMGERTIVAGSVEAWE